MLPPITTARCTVIARLPSPRAGADESSRCRPALALRAVRLHRLRSPAQLSSAGGRELERVAGPAPRLLGDQDRSAEDLGELLHARRDVHRVADRGVLAPPRGADVAHHDRARVHADPHAQRRLAARDARAVERGERLLHGRAQRTARGAWSGWATGAPKYAMSPSPRYLSSVPPCAKTVSTMRAWYSFSMATTCSPESASLRAVNSRRSLKRRVTSRLSPAAAPSPSASTRAATWGEK